jgi:two-component system chemotaxis response regulator CheY
MVGALLVKLFSHAGYEVAHVLDGADALKRIQAAPSYFDVLVTDHHMPKMTGLELCTELVAAKFPGRIIVHSANLKKDTRAAYARLGITTVIEKSTASDELLATVEALEKAGS